MQWQEQKRLPKSAWMRCFEAAWQDWLATENEYAKGDALFWETIIKPCTNFVGMVIQKRSKS